MLHRPLKPCSWDSNRETLTMLLVIAISNVRMAMFFLNNSVMIADHDRTSL